MEGKETHLVEGGGGGCEEGAVALVEECNDAPWTHGRIRLRHERLNERRRGGGGRYGEGKGGRERDVE